MTYLKEHNTKEIMEHFKSSFNYFLLHYLHRSQVFYWRHNLEPGWVAGRAWGPSAHASLAIAFIILKLPRDATCVSDLQERTHAGTRPEVRPGAGRLGGTWVNGRAANISIYLFLYLFIFGVGPYCTSIYVKRVQGQTAARLMFKRIKINT